MLVNFLAFLQSCNMFDQLGLLVGNDFSAADDGIDEVFGHLEGGVVAGLVFVVIVEITLEVMKRDRRVFIVVCAVSDPRRINFIELASSTLLNKQEFLLSFFGDKINLLLLEDEVERGFLILTK